MNGIIKSSFSNPIEKVGTNELYQRSIDNAVLCNWSFS